MSRLIPPPLLCLVLGLAGGLIVERTLHGRDTLNVINRKEAEMNTNLTVRELFERAPDLSLGTWYVVVCYLLGIFVIRSFVKKNLALPRNGGYDGQNNKPPLMVTAIFLYAFSPLTIPFMILWKYWAYGTPK